MASDNRIKRALNAGKLMIKIINIITLTICVCGAFFGLVLFPDYQRATFGTETGNSLLLPEIIIIGFICLSVYMKRKGRDHIAKSSFFISISILCFLIGWHSNPLRVYERSIERVVDLELQSVDRQSQLTTSSAKDKRQLRIYLSRLNTELAARRNELIAAKIRYNGDPEYFKEKFTMYVWWFFSLTSLALTILNLIEFLRLRYEVYCATTAFIASIVQSGKVEYNERIKFLRDTKPAKLLFPKKTTEYLDGIHSKACDLQCLIDELDGVGVGPERSENVKKQRELNDWFYSQLTDIDRMFLSFIKLKHW